MYYITNKHKHLNELMDYFEYLNCNDLQLVGLMFSCIPYELGVELMANAAHTFSPRFGAIMVWGVLMRCHMTQSKSTARVN